MIEFEVPYLPRMNTGAGRRHWAIQARRAKELKAVVAALVPLARRPPAPWLGARVRVVRCSAVEPDFDNMVYSAKPIFDALVEIGVLAGDRPREVERVYEWEPAPRRNGCVRVQVTEPNEGERR